MSILKSILHRYNTTSQDYDTLHPETEYAQVTDFGQGVIAHLASSTLVSLVTSVSTGSVFGKMVEKLLEASGVQYNFQNSNAWYICLGSLFGGLIIQGGLTTVPNRVTWNELSLPISFPSSALEHLGSCCWADSAAIAVTGAGSGHSDRDYFRIAASITSVQARWLVIGH